MRHTLLFDKTIDAGSKEAIWLIECSTKDGIECQESNLSPTWNGSFDWGLYDPRTMQWAGAVVEALPSSCFLAVKEFLAILQPMMDHQKRKFDLGRIPEGCLCSMDGSERMLLNRLGALSCERNERMLIDGSDRMSITGSGLVELAGGGCVSGDGSGRVSVCDLFDFGRVSAGGGSGRV